MKRVLEPPERGSTPNPADPRAASPDDHAKRSKQQLRHQQQQQQKRPQQDLKSNNSRTEPSSQASTEHLGQFRAVLAANGVVWPAVPGHGLSLIHI